jgi:valyl-tRNA synthetase
MQDIPKTFDPKSAEETWYPKWEAKGYFTVDANDQRPPFTIVIPPPNVTGVLHMGHALDLTLQDILIRYKRMNGFAALWIPGTDHAGIATQNVVERHLESQGIFREKIGREAFLQHVWEWKDKHGNEILNQIRKFGASCDWTRQRFTFDEGLSYAVRKAFVELYHEKLIYQSEYLVNWDPKNKTAVSDLEVEHKETQGTLTYFKYNLVEGGEIVVATTRPETMLGDTAIAVHPKDTRYKKLIGKHAQHPFLDRKILIIGDDEVKKDFGTGAVKVTPAHDPNDYAMGIRHKLEFISIFDKEAKTNELTGKFAGLDRFVARKKIIEELKTLGHFVKQETITHAVGHSQRTGVMVEPMMSTQWFVKTKPLAKEAINAVKKDKTQFVPSNWTKTYLGWMDNIHDWCISRQIWWGHRIPVWYCKKCEHKTVTMEDPSQCEKCKSSDIFQDPDVLDTWFSSSLWPFSTLGWPNKTDDLKKFYPTSVLVTGFDIIFFWVARMMMMSMKFMKAVPFEVVHIHALVRDENGQKMSKSKGNVINPLTIMDKYGTDAFRFTIAALAVQGRDILLSEKRIEGYRNFVNKLWNASRYALSNIPENFKYDSTSVLKNKSMVDTWILARLSETIQQTHKSLDEMKFNEAAETLYQFTWHEFCDWYLEFSKLNMNETTLNTVLYVLEQILKLLHPIMPFITEEIWQKLPIDKKHESIMISEFPQPFKIKVEPTSLRQIEKLKGIITTIRTIRSGNKIPPSAKFPIHIWSNDKDKSHLTDLESYILKLCSVDSISFEPIPSKKNIAYGVFENVEMAFSLEGLIDKDSEIERLTKEYEKAHQDVAFLQRRLQDQNYIQKAPPQLIQKDQDKLTGAQEKLDKLKKSMDELSAK